ncbi:MAG: hypothetical protein LJE60_08805, partial [Thiocapsa sp.]|nr:hypothetical protein [Thiocapsa sp.]
MKRIDPLSPPRSAARKHGACDPDAETPPPPEATRARELLVDAESDGQRIDNFLLRHLKGVPRSH